MPTTTTDDLDKELLGEQADVEEAQESPSPFSPPATLGGGLPPLEPLNPFSRQAPQFQRNRPGVQPARGLPHFSSLESLYGHVQELGTDQARLRVERLEPQWAYDGEGKKIAVAGIIGYIDDTPSTQQFTRRFGGRRYKVWAERQIPDKGTGEPRAMDVAYAEFQVPLDPNLEELPIVGDESDAPGADGFVPFPDAPYRRYSPMNRRGVFFNNQPSSGSGFRPDDAVNLIRTGAEMARNNGQAPAGDASAPLQFLSGLTQAQQSQMREYAERQEAVYRDQIRERDRQLQELREEMRDMRNRPTSQGEVLGGVAQLVGALKGSTSEIEHSQLRASHEREIDRLNDQFQREKEALRREHERDVSALRSEAKADKDRWLEKERELQREMDRRDQIMRDEMDRREKSTRADAERELSMVRQMHESQINSLRQSYEDKLLMTKMHAEGLGTQKETAMQMLVENLRRDLATIAADRDRLREEADMLRAKVNKTVEEAIDEAHRLAAKTGMISRDEAGGGDGANEVPKSRVDQIIDALAGAAMSNAPALLEGIGNIATSIGGKKDARQQQAQPVRATAQVQEQRPRFVEAGDEFVSTRQLQQAHPAAVAPTVPAPAYRPQEAQVRQAAPQSPPAQAPAAAPPTAPPPPPPPENPWEGFEWTSLEPAQLQEILGTIDASMQNGESPQACFDGMKAKYGDTIELVGSFAPAERIVASIQRAPATRHSRLATKSGRRFIRQLWKLMAPPQATEEAT